MRALQFILIGSITIGLMGCVSWRAEDAPVTPHYYILEVERGEVAESNAENLPTLALRPLRVTSKFRGETILFRIGDQGYQSQTDHQFINNPQQMLTQQLQSWLDKSGLFSQVVTDERIPTDFILETAVTAFYGEARPNFSPAAVLEMQFFLTSSLAENDTLFEFGLRVSSDVLVLTPPAVVIGWRQALLKTLIALEVNLSDYFQN